MNVVTKTANYTAKGSDVVLVDATSGAVTITLPLTVTGAFDIKTPTKYVGEVTVKKVDSGAYLVTVVPSGVAQIDGGSTMVIGAANESIKFVSDGDNWWAMRNSAIHVVTGALVAGAADAISFAWQNPHATGIIVDHVIVAVATAGGTALAVMNVAVVANATATGDTILDGIDINAVATYDSRVAANAGTDGTCKPTAMDAKDGANAYITGKILVAAAAALVGTYYIFYTLL